MARETTSCPRLSWSLALSVLLALLFLSTHTVALAEPELEIKGGTKWDNKSNELRIDVHGKEIPGGPDVTLMLYDASSGELIFGFPVTLDERGRFKNRFTYPIADNADVPCRVRVELANLSDERKVEKAPFDCSGADVGDGEVEVKKVRWEADRSQLRIDIKGERVPGGPNVTLLLRHAVNDALIASFPIQLRKEGKFKFKTHHPIADPASVPCEVNLVLGDLSIQREVERAPENCDAGGVPPDNLPPTADAGPDQSITLAPGQASVDVTLDGSGSNDPDGTIAGYVWTGVPDPDDVVSPMVNLGPGTHFFSLIVTDDDGAESTPDTVMIVVTAAAENQPPVADAGPDQTINLAEGQATTTVILDGSGSSDPDGSIIEYNWTGMPDPADVVSPSVTLGAGTHVFTLVVIDDDAASSAADTVTVVVNPFVAGDPHAGLTFANYQGSATCIDCHQSETEEAHAAVHYQWQGETPHSFYRDENGNLVNLGGGGKLGGINDFCGYPDINFIGLLTDVDGNTRSGGCAQCHAGTGDKPDPNPAALLADGTRTQLENVDCLVCHSDAYKRKVERVQQADGVMRLAFVPDGDAIAGGLQQAIDIHESPSTATCVACHSYAGGGCNSKRGDIQLAHVDLQDPNFDVHLASADAGGAGLTCLDCHTALDHRIAGRGVDLRPADLDETVACTNCHEAQPHHESELDKHTARVDCRSCHIPFFAKQTPLDGATDMFRDYSQAPEFSEEQRLFEPFQIMESNVSPVYVFDNGTSEFYRFLDPIRPQSNGRVLMAGPLGEVSEPGVKLIPVKHHMAVQPHDPVTGALLPLRMGILFTGRDPMTGELFADENDIVPAAVLAGAAAVPEFAHVTSEAFFDFVPTERFMGISHEVVPEEMALGCNDCHGPGATRVDFAALGYSPLPTRDPDVATNCGAGCHGDESDEWDADEFFIEVHEEHVDGENINCSACHGFSTATN